MTLAIHFAEPQRFHQRNTVFIGYGSRPSEHLHSLEGGEIVLSKPTQKPLSSSEYKDCFGIAGQSPTGHNVLAHICPGTLERRGFSSVFLRKHAARIGEILGEWREQAGFTNNTQIGIFGSYIFPKNAKDYLNSVEILCTLLANTLPGDPQVLAAPIFYKGIQHATVTDKGVTIYRPLQKVTFPQETHFSLKQIRARVNLLTS